MSTITGTLLVWPDDDAANKLYVPLAGDWLVAGAVEHAVEEWAEQAESGGRFADGDYPDGDMLHVRHVESGAEWRAFLRTEWSPTWLVDCVFPAPGVPPGDLGEARDAVFRDAPTAIVAAVLGGA